MKKNIFDGYPASEAPTLEEIKKAGVNKKSSSKKSPKKEK